MGGCGKAWNRVNRPQVFISCVCMYPLCRACCCTPEHPSPARSPPLHHNLHSPSRWSLLKRMVIPRNGKAVGHMPRGRRWLHDSRWRGRRAHSVRRGRRRTQHRMETTHCTSPGGVTNSPLGGNKFFGEARSERRKTQNLMYFKNAAHFCLADSTHKNLEEFMASGAPRPHFFTLTTTNNNTASHTNQIRQGD